MNVFRVNFRRIWSQFLELKSPNFTVPKLYGHIHFFGGKRGTACAYRIFIGKITTGSKYSTDSCTVLKAGRGVTDRVETQHPIIITPSSIFVADKPPEVEHRHLATDYTLRRSPTAAPFASVSLVGKSPHLRLVPSALGKNQMSNFTVTGVRKAKWVGATIAAPSQATMERARSTASGRQRHYSAVELAGTGEKVLVDDVVEVSTGRVSSSSSKHQASSSPVKLVKVGRQLVNFACLAVEFFQDGVCGVAVCVHNTVVLCFCPKVGPSLPTGRRASY